MKNAYSLQLYRINRVGGGKTLNLISGEFVQYRVLLYHLHFVDLQRGRVLSHLSTPLLPEIVCNNPPLKDSLCISGHC